MGKEELQRIATAFTWGLAIGAAGFAVIGFGFGLVTLTSTADEAQAEAVEAAKIQQLASLCESQARAYRVEMKDSTDITGWEQRDARHKLAMQFAIALPGTDAADDAVIQACASRLDSA